MVFPTGLEAIGVGAVLVAFSVTKPHRHLRRRRHPLAPIGFLIEVLFFWGGISLALTGLFGLPGQ